MNLKTQNGVQMALAQRVFLHSGLVGCMMLAAGSAGYAADRAMVDVIGYSQELNTFAFEQFGVQDGSGFPYSQVFIVDLDTDTFVGGSPFRVLEENEDTSLTQVRAQAQGLAAAAMTEFDITRAAVPLAVVGDADPKSDGRDIEFGVVPFWGQELADIRALSISQFDGVSKTDCVGMFEKPTQGLIISENGAPIYQDEKVPASRGCVFDYKFFGAYAPMDFYGHEHDVALISVWAYGFEGGDRRFMAVPIGVNTQK